MIITHSTDQATGSALTTVSDGRKVVVIRRSRAGQYFTLHPEFYTREDIGAARIVSGQVLVDAITEAMKLIEGSYGYGQT
jgi:hypothetical protein